MHSTKPSFFTQTFFMAGLFLIGPCIKTLSSGRNIGILGLFETKV